METKKKDYASKRLPYPLEKGDISAYDKLISTLYSESERHKIEWAIGSIVAGDSKTIQKFIVLYGAAGTGKSTILNIIQMLFDGYYSVFDAKALGSSTNAFALESFKTNPLVAIQHDGDLSRIEDNTRLNSLVSHELMTVNEKFRSAYSNRFKAFLFMGTNKPVKITDARSGLIRRLIDVSPTGKKIPIREYKDIMAKIPFELGGIAEHCKEVYLKDQSYYDNYIPTVMLGASNDFYNFVMDAYHIFKEDDGTTMKAAWEMYKTYCDEARVPYPFSQKAFKEELKNYFWEYNDRFTLDGTRVRSYYKGFRTDKFEENNQKEEVTEKRTIELSYTESIFDKLYANCKAQYANEDGRPLKKWENVTTTLADIDTSKLHYVMLPEANHIVIDFDIRDSEGNKSLEKNLEAASAWPKTYAELSKSGSGVHLHYIYSGDVSKLSRVFDDNIEIKVFNGNSSLRRRLTKCNDIQIAIIASGLPLKGEKKLVNFEAVKSEKRLRNQIEKCLNKEYNPSTAPNVNFIHHLLEEAYDSGMHYDVSDMYNDILAFALNSTNQKERCAKLVDVMHFKSDDISDNKEAVDKTIIFFDVEVFPNLFLVNWKAEGENKPIVRMINPTSDDISELMEYNLVGFNCRRYDNHILYGRLIGYNNEQLYNLSQRIIRGERDAFFGEAYNVSYTDVYDFSSEKKSLKKFEIELGIHHQELGLPWDQPVDESLWPKVAEYCDNDVIATEAVFNKRYSDFIAREILADVAGMTVNDTTNTLTTKIIFENDREPQKEFNYRNMGDTNQDLYRFTINAKLELFDNLGDEYTVFDSEGRPVFPGYSFEHEKSVYRGEEVGEGGYVYSEPGMYWNVALLDIASMHPSSIIAENLFGKYTIRFKELVEARIAIKHKDFKKARGLLNGKLSKYLDDESKAKDLAQALKIAINSVYGLTAANFKNSFRDIRNKDNIVAKRGALFMVNLKHEVQKRGFIVAHIKTDSIKIPNATADIIQFVMDYGKQYGYSFEHEATYERMCLVNDAVYIAKYKDGGWTATGTQFQIPYVFKTLFSKEPINFSDLCETKSVTSALYLDRNENKPDVTQYEKELEKIKRDLKQREKKGDIPSEGVMFDIQGKIYELEDYISLGHAYQFVGKVGLFCPVVDGVGGGYLLREKDGKFNAATGTKGYRWLEAEEVKERCLEDSIDKRYFNKMVDDAVDTISKYGDFEQFIADDIIWKEQKGD